MAIGEMLLQRSNKHTQICVGRNTWSRGFSLITKFMNIHMISPSAGSKVRCVKQKCNKIQTWIQRGVKMKKKRCITSGKSANECVVYQLVVMPDRHQHISHVALDIHCKKYTLCSSSSPFGSSEQCAGMSFSIDLFLLKNWNENAQMNMPQNIELIGKSIMRLNALEHTHHSFTWILFHAKYYSMLCTAHSTYVLLSFVSRHAFMYTQLWDNSAFEY